MFFFTTYHHTKIKGIKSYNNTVIELRNKNEQNVISYSEIKKIEIFIVKKFQTIAMYLLPTLYLTSLYIYVDAEFI